MEILCRISYDGKKTYNHTRNVKKA